MQNNFEMTMKVTVLTLENKQGLLSQVGQSHDSGKWDTYLDVTLTAHNGRWR